MLFGRSRSRARPGSAAGGDRPDVELDIGARDRRRTGERVRLSALRGQTVGLVFGSYT